MSDWIHVCGTIRIDDFRRGKLPNFDKLIGKECLWESDDKVWDDAEKHPDKYLPMGSEGSLHKDVWVNPDPSCIAAYTVTIFGDLRDRSNAEEFVEWFQNKVMELDSNSSPVVGIRDAVISVTGFGEVKVWSYAEALMKERQEQEEKER